ncbi:MAG: aspartate--tRNA ligase [Nanoarchaeota archaeon]|nr:aspartate--tRNA ligase [Nanoarchaeota archaeon]
MKRTNTCGELSKNDIKKSVELAGWMASRRDHGGIIFVDLRDRYGLTQVVLDPKHNKAAHKIAEHVSREDVLHIKGKVRARGKDLENPKLKTGEIEVIVDELEILNKAMTPPIEIDDNKEASEEVRMKYRYLDLRRPKMQKHLEFRAKVAQATREYFTDNNFIEITTPLLVKSTPEGARDYVVPSRVNPGKFYALPQSPQLYKQILMCSGMDRYFQLPICLRDEDLRADRQPEHTQIDVEMSFVDLEDLWTTFEGLYKHIWKKVLGKDLKTPFPRIPYKESMDKYGNDKPDIRYDLHLVNVNNIVKGSEFGVFNSIIEHGGLIKCVASPGELSRKELDEYITFAQELGAKGMAWMRVGKDGLESNIAKYFSDKIKKELVKATGAKEGQILMFVADKEKVTNAVLGRLRIKLADHFKIYDQEEFNFCWITEFPLFEWDDDNEKWEMAHHMFCMPKKEHIKFIESDPGKVICTQYDLVMNGWELGSGSIRNHSPEVQKTIMKSVGFDEKEAEERFGFLLEAFKYGAPPHGGIGIGFDRTVALMLHQTDIREVIAFPKNKSAECPMDGSPGKIDERQMKELHISTTTKK